MSHDLTLRECPECKMVYLPKETEQVFCSRRCARIKQARQGLPSYEDVRASLLSEFGGAIDKYFKPK